MIITKHDPGKQQTDLELIYGKVRADVTLQWLGSVAVTGEKSMCT